MSKASIDETVVVIGGGYAGLTSAIQLKMAGYKNVIIVEKNEAVFRGPSNDAFRLHLGGEYPLDVTTGLNCVRGAIAFKQMFPDDIFTPVPPANFMIAAKTEEEHPGSVDGFEKYYDTIQQHYKNHIDQYLKEKKAGNNQVAKDQAYAELFGNPSDMIKKLSAEECGYTSHIAGGFKTKEIGISPVAAGTFLEEAAQHLGITILTNSEVTDITPNGKGGYGLTIPKGINTKVIEADQVVNASWHNAFALNQKIDLEGHKDKKVDVHLRAMGIVDISGLKLELDNFPPTFVMQGKEGGMWCPINDSVAAIYLPSEKGAYIDSVTLTQNNPHIPKDWETRSQLQHSDPEMRQRMMHILTTLSENIYPFLKGATMKGLLIHPTISYDIGDLSKRRDAGVAVIAEGFTSATPTKATYSALTAIEVLREALRTSVKRGKISEEQAKTALGFELNSEVPVLLPQTLSIAEMVNQKRSEIEQNKALQMGLPSVMALKPRKRHTATIVSLSINTTPAQSEDITRALASVLSSDGQENGILQKQINHMVTSSKTSPSPIQYALNGAPHSI